MLCGLTTQQEEARQRQGHLVACCHHGRATAFGRLLRLWLRTSPRKKGTLLRAEKPQTAASLRGCLGERGPSLIHCLASFTAAKARFTRGYNLRSKRARV